MSRANAHVLLAAALCVAFAAVWAPGVSMDLAWGWDETMHAEAGALRMQIALVDLDARAFLRALHDCERYPFGWPAILAVVQAFTGPSELAARITARVLWAVGLFGLFLLAREVSARTRGAETDAAEASTAPWIALALGAASPLAVCYSGTLFLETPFVAVSFFALRAWIRRGRDAPLARELVAGALVTAAFFVKFNYGLLLGLGLALDLACEGFGEARAGRFPRFARRTAVLAAPALAAFAWWFLVPLPFGAETAASHRHALVDFLRGNTSATMQTPWSIRAMHWTSFLCVSPRVLLVILAGVVIALRRWRDPAVRALALAGIASIAPVAAHGFHLDRFLLPGAAILWVLAGAGIAALLPRRIVSRGAVLAALFAAATVRPEADAMLVARAVGLARPEIEEHQRAVLARLRDLRPGRALETNGLERATYDRVVDLCLGEVRAADVVGFVGNSHILSPVAVHAGTWMRGGPGRDELAAGRFEEDFVAIGNDDPAWSDERLLAWAARFTLLLTTDPIDMTENPNRRWLARYQERLDATGRFEKRLLGRYSVARPLREPIQVELHAMRPLP